MTARTFRELQGTRIILGIFPAEPLPTSPKIAPSATEAILTKSRLTGLMVTIIPTIHFPLSQLANHVRTVIKERPFQFTSSVAPFQDVGLQRRLLKVFSRMERRLGKAQPSFSAGTYVTVCVAANNSCEMRAIAGANRKSFDVTIGNKMSILGFDTEKPR